VPHAAAPAVASPAPGEDRLIIHLAIAGNALVALSKFIAAAMTGSSAMWSEGVHSLADLANEVFVAGASVSFLQGATWKERRATLASPDTLPP